jgi:hypothetical protein
MARSLLLALVIAAQAVLPAFAFAAQSGRACCETAAGAKKCHCPACETSRTLESGQDALGGCSHATGVALPITSVIAVPHVAVPLFVSPRTARPAAAGLPAPPFLSDEVPTPPPLA